MQIVTNESYVRNKVKRGNLANIASLGLLAIGFVLSLVIDRLGQMAIFLAYAAMIAAFLLLSYSRTFTRRWGQRFRQDQWLVPALRGTDNRYAMFNYASPELPDHVLVGPNGLFVLVPKPNGGAIRFDGKGWSRGSLASSVFRSLSEGGLGNPMDDVRKAMAQLAAYLKAHGSEQLIEGLEARPIIVFTNPGVKLQVKGAPLSIVETKDLKSVIKRAKSVLPPEKVDELRSVLGREVQS